MKKLYFYFLLIILFLGLVKALTEVEQSVEATVTVNPVAGILNVSPEYLAVNAPPLSFIEKILIFQQDGNINLSVSLYLETNGINNWFVFSESEFIVKPQEEKEIIAFINISAVEPGYHSTNIYATANNQNLIIPVNITVTDKYKIDVNIDVSPRKIKAGDYISVLTKLTKSKLKKPDTDVEGKITVNLEYNISKQKELIKTVTTTMDVIDYSEKNISILIPTNATSGSYTVEVIATHLDKIAKDKDNFLVGTNWLRRFFNFFGWFG